MIAGLVVEDEEAVRRYWFTHGLVQETLYEQLSRTRRVRLHARLAETLLGLHGPEDPEHIPELARHAWAAVPVTGAEAALPLVLAAADQAMARLAYEQAEQQLRALELLESAAAVGRAHPAGTRRAGAARDLLGQLRSPGSPEAATMFERAVELASEVADDPAAIPALVGIRGLTTRSELDRARELAERVLEGAQRSADPQALLAGHYFLGQTLFLQGELVAAREHLEEAVRLAEAMPNASWLPGYPLDLGAAGFLEFTLVLLGLHDPGHQRRRGRQRALRTRPPLLEALMMGAGVFAAVAAIRRCCCRPGRGRGGVDQAVGIRMLAVAATAPLGWAQAIEGDPPVAPRCCEKPLPVGRPWDCGR